MASGQLIVNNLYRKKSHLDSEITKCKSLFLCQTFPFLLAFYCSIFSTLECVDWDDLTGDMETVWTAIHCYQAELIL